MRFIETVYDINHKKIKQRVPLFNDETLNHLF